MVFDGTMLAIAGVGVAAFDVYAYYKYKHALDVAEERAGKAALQSKGESAVELPEEPISAATGIENGSEEVAMVFEPPIEAQTLKDYQPSNEDAVRELAEKNARLEAELSAIKGDLKHFAAYKPKAKKARKRK